MKVKAFKFLLTSTIIANALFFSYSVAAQTVTLYEQPDAKAKVVGSADLSSGIIPIYTPAKSDWIKVADPRNGNVGWIKSNEISKAGSSSVTFTQKIISTDKQPHQYQVIQFGTPSTQIINENLSPNVSPNNLSPNSSSEKLDALKNKMQLEQQQLQNSFQSIVKDMNDFFQYQINMWKDKNNNSTDKNLNTNKK